jgi:hypothetical protein
MLGFDVGWNGATQQATLTSPDYTVILTVGSTAFTTNGTSHTLDVPAQIIGGRTMLPIRAVLESVGYDLDWDAATRTVVVSSAPIPDRWAQSAADTRSAIALPNRRLSYEERADWMREWERLGGANEFELEVIRLINEIRRENNVPEFIIDNSLMMAARFNMQLLIDTDRPLTGQGFSIVSGGPYGDDRNILTAFTGNAGGWTRGKAGGATPQDVVDYWLAGAPTSVAIITDIHDGVNVNYIGVGRSLGGSDGAYTLLALASSPSGPVPTPAPTPEPFPELAEPRLEQSLGLMFPRIVTFTPPESGLWQIGVRIPRPPGFVAPLPTPGLHPGIHFPAPPEVVSVSKGGDDIRRTFSRLANVFYLQEGDTYTITINVPYGEQTVDGGPVLTIRRVLE